MDALGRPVDILERTVDALGRPLGILERTVDALGRPVDILERTVVTPDAAQTLELPMSIWNWAPVTARAKGEVRYSTASLMSSVEATGKWSIIEMK